MSEETWTHTVHDTSQVLSNQLATALSLSCEDCEDKINKTRKIPVVQQEGKSNW